MPAARDDDDEYSCRAERDKFHAVEDSRFGRRANGKADAARCLREHMRDLRQQRIDVRTGIFAAESLFHGVRRPSRALGFEQQVHIKAVPTIGRNAPGGSMRLLHKAFRLEPRKDVADRGRRHAKPCGGNQHRGGNRFSR